jgi:hypothetical protein
MVGKLHKSGFSGFGCENSNYRLISEAKIFMPGHASEVRFCRYTRAWNFETGLFTAVCCFFYE